MKLFGFNTTAEDIKLADKIKGITSAYPSMRVIGRGTVVINPADIINSTSYITDSLKASNLIKLQK